MIWFQQIILDNKHVGTIMRRVTKKWLLFLLGVILTCIYCDFLIYYVVIIQCSWPGLQQLNDSTNALKAFVLADTHLLGPHRGHWLDKWRRETQMHRAFQAIIRLHKPEVVFVLGDLFDEGEWSDDKQFDDYVDRFFRLFAVPNNIRMHVVPGNHDIGFHNYIWPGSHQRFSKLLNSSSVQFLTLKDNHFVLMNSMAMHGDSCELCIEARRRIGNISGKLKCSKNPNLCKNNRIKKIKYSRPILLQHFPLHRLSDAVCTEPDAPPLPERNKPFIQKKDSLSKEATEYLVNKIRPRAVFGGHTHHGCLLLHNYSTPEPIEFQEFSVPSFSWRNRPDPKYMLVTITPEAYAVNKCGLPKETTIVTTALIFISLATYYTLKKRSFVSYLRMK